MQTWGVTFVEVGVDRDLGIIRFRRAVARYSAGRIINPLTARTMIGSIIWEWGKATMEASPIEPTHARFLAKNLSNVSVPVNADIPSAIDVGFVENLTSVQPDRRPRHWRTWCDGCSGSNCERRVRCHRDSVREVPILPSHILEGRREELDRSGPRGNLVNRR